ncbi:GTPase IMAP family member 7-like [Plectropomus leopardus]|uniref:GTPase IMAP family member 7-like n=1 Tax=Plectropomus leopardus TaxID=160734 RepID=UPI001C4C5625|nr:GTPase IMAP family member 7-like [Plectropomus leopardus]
MDMSNTRIVILGKTGAGKSSLANTIFGEKHFAINNTANSGTTECQAKTKSVSGRSITLIDTPGFFDTDKSEEELKPEILRCITRCAPGPHAFLIVLKVDKFTEQEKELISKINEYFSEEVFKYATLVFTNGEQLPEGEKIQDFVHKNKSLSDLVKKCGGRCHVVDNKYWKERSESEYRSNRFQVKELLKTIHNTILANKGGCYTNEMLQAVEEAIQQEEQHIRQSGGNMLATEIREQARNTVSKRLLNKLAGIVTGALLGGFFGWKRGRDLAQLGRSVVAAGGGTGEAIGKVLAILTVISTTLVGAGMGAVRGKEAAEGAHTPWEAASRAAAAVTTNEVLGINQ